MEEDLSNAKANPDDDSYVEQFLGAGYALKGDSIDLSVRLEPGRRVLGPGGLNFRSRNHAVP